MTIKRDRKKGYLIIALAALLSLAATLAFSAATADHASAQLQPDICNQYPDLPQCEEGTGGSGGGGDGAPGAIPGGGDAAPTAGDVGTKGELPFTGYPITALILLLLVLLAAGLTIRAYLAVRDRVRARGSGPTGTA